MKCISIFFHFTMCWFLIIPLKCICTNQYSHAIFLNWFLDWFERQDESISVEVNGIIIRYSLGLFNLLHIFTSKQIDFILIWGFVDFFEHIFWGWHISTSEIHPRWLKTWIRDPFIIQMLSFDPFNLIWIRFLMCFNWRFLWVIIFHPAVSHLLYELKNGLQF